MLAGHLPYVYGQRRSLSPPSSSTMPLHVQRVRRALDLSAFVAQLRQSAAQLDAARLPCAMRRVQHDCPTQSAANPSDHGYWDVTHALECDTVLNARRALPCRRLALSANRLITASSSDSEEEHSSTANDTHLAQILSCHRLIRRARLRRVARTQSTEEEPGVKSTGKSASTTTAVRAPALQELQEPHLPDIAERSACLQHADQSGLSGKPPSDSLTRTRDSLWRHIVVSLMPRGCQRRATRMQRRKLTCRSVALACSHATAARHATCEQRLGSETVVCRMRRVSNAVRQDWSNASAQSNV